MNCRLRATVLAMLVSTCTIAAEQGSQSPSEVDSNLPSYVPREQVGGSLHSVGSDAMDVITFGWIQLFRKHHPDCRVTIEARSSLTAAPALTAGVADVAPVAREFMPSELGAFQRKFGYPPTPFRVAGGSYATRGRTHALGIFVHRDNPINELTLAQLDAIYSTERRRGHASDLTTWGQLGLTGEWADRPIHAYGLRRPNGIVNFFQSHVMLDGPFKSTIRERVTEEYVEAFDAVMNSLANDPGGVAYASFAHHSPATKCLKLAHDSSGPFVAGTHENVLNRSYPLSRFIHIYVNLEPGKELGVAEREFLRLVLSREGQSIVAAEGIYMPLPASIVREELARLGGQNTGNIANR